jgi:single-strand DNA-binding protein
MAMSLNKVQLIGNLTRDPEMRQIPGGQVVASFGLATNLSWTDQSGQRQDKAEFHNIVAWRKLAEICGQYLKKGSKCYIEGRIQTRSWEAEDGSKRYKTEIVADNMIMLDRKGDAIATDAAPMMQAEHGGMDQAPEPAPTPKPQAATSAAAPAPQPATTTAPPEDEVTVDDLPF